MRFDDNMIIEILQNPPSEGPYIDYKQIPYKPNQNPDFLKDVIAMLNSEAAIGKDKFIVIGVSNVSRELIGIKPEQWKDDNEWQNLINKITPRPDVRTGCVRYLDKWFGFIYIPGSNNEWVYEAAESVISSPEDKVKEKHIIAKGQAYTRVGSVNEVLLAEGRKRLLEKKVQQKPQLRKQLLAFSDDNSVSVALALVGAWNEEYSGDVEIIERLSGASIEDIKLSMREIKEKHPEDIQFSKNAWKLSDHKEALITESKHIFDEHIDLFFDAIATCTNEYDPKFELPDDKRSFAALYQKGIKKKYSKTIVSGLTETLAILGNNDTAFVNCSRYKVINSIYQYERDFFMTTDWRVYATCSNEMQMLGEACPNIFMDEIERLLRNKDSAFLEFLSEKEQTIHSINYGYEIGFVLSNIAKLEKYFSKAILTLFLLSEVRSDFVDVIVGVVLPWYPQTHAPSAVRVGVFKGLAQENEKLTWDILMNLMPYATTTGSPIQRSKYLEVEEIPEQITKQDYTTTTIGYIRLAESMLNNDIDRLCAIVSVIDDVDVVLQTEIIEAVKKNSLSLNDSNKSVLWNKLKDFTHKHRKFSDAEWALGEERLIQVDELADWLVPDSKHLFSIRLFRNDQYSLFFQNDSSAEEEATLRKAQTDVLNELYDTNGLEGLLLFIDSVENKKLAGLIAGGFLNDEEILFFINHSKAIANDNFLEGVIISRTFADIIPVIDNLTDSTKAEIVGKLPLTDDLIRYVDDMAEDAQTIFWKATPVWGFMNSGFSMIEETINKLNQHQRTDKSIELLYFFAIHEKRDIEEGIVVETLKIHADNQNTNTQNEYCIQEIIKWLQEKGTDSEALFEVEWKYLAFLRQSEGYPPITIWQELSDNPHFYVWIIKVVCGKEKEDWNENDQRKIARHCYNLLYGWKRIPGLNSSGEVDKDKLAQWFETVKTESETYGITRMAMSYFGRTTFYAPADKDGLFIDREVAKYLQADVEGSILSGYHAEAIDSRGVYNVDTTGQTEFKIEAKYISKAREADENGMFRLAETLRDIASSYHEEGVRNQELRWDE